MSLITINISWDYFLTSVQLFVGLCMFIQYYF